MSASSAPRQGMPQRNEDSLLARQYEQLFNTIKEQDDDSEDNKQAMDFGLQNSNKNNEMSDTNNCNEDQIYKKEQTKIYKKFSQQTGVDLISGNRVSSQIPSEFFMKNSTIALEDEQHEQEIVFEPPQFDRDSDYYSKFWSSFVQNEKILNSIQNLASENHKNLDQIYHMEDFYENNLLPKMFAFPHQYVARIIANNNRKTGQKEIQKKGNDEENVQKKVKKTKDTLAPASPTANESKVRAADAVTHASTPNKPKNDSTDETKVQQQS